MESSKADEELRPTQVLTPEQEAIIERDVIEASVQLKHVLDEVNSVVWGQEDIVELTLTCAVAGGNVLLEGVPGLAKTRFLENLAPILALDFNRVQFTPDLMPADILGSEILQEGADGQKHFEFQEGPAFTQLLMADEINRAGPRTQAALLQAMQEKAISIAGETRLLPNPFMVVATQNPLEQDGTYPLPEAQLDRFLLKINMDYPDRNAFKKIITKTTSSSPMSYLDMKAAKEAGADLTVREESANKLDVNKVLPSAADLVLMQKLAKTLPLTEEFVKAVCDVVEYTRPDNEKSSKLVQEHVAWGAGPRAGQAFAEAARARALIQGRFAPDLSDIKALAKPIMGHRMAVSYAARAGGITTDKIIDDVLETHLGM